MTESTTERGEPTRFRLDIAYQGTDFAGWSRQPGQRTVQGVLEQAISTSFGDLIGRPALYVAGRTDAGVHAVGQVVHLDLSPDAMERLGRQRGGRTDPAGALARRANGVLGPYSDVAITRATLAPAGFDARFGALWRRYQYRVADLVAGRNPLQRAYTAWLPTSLDIGAMNEAASVLLGLHDFGAYCKPRDGATTIRTLLDFGWRRDEDGVLRADVRADAFCHSMVRALVGATVAVGEGRLSIVEVMRLRDGASRDDAYAVMPSRGLTFMEVAYPPDDQLAERAELTRARRTLAGGVADADDVE